MFVEGLGFDLVFVHFFSVFGCQ